MGNRRSLTLALVVAAGVALGSSACTRTFHSEVVQPNPLVKPTETLRDSEIVRIITGDMELNVPRDAESRVSLLRHKRYPLFNEASFTVVSRDRLRFHVQLEHKWIEWADLNVVGGLPRRRSRPALPARGHRARQDQAHGQHVGLRDPQRPSATTVRRHRRRSTRTAGSAAQTLGSLSVFRGTADFVFYQRDLFTPEMQPA
jgi:hypothetical protein